MDFVGRGVFASFGELRRERKGGGGHRGRRLVGPVKTTYLLFVLAALLFFCLFRSEEMETKGIKNE